MPADLLATAYDPLLVSLSVIVAVLAAAASLGVAERIWAAQGPARTAWIAASAVALGGGIWSMHFIGMLAVDLPVALEYRASLTLASLAIAILVTGFGFQIVAGGTQPARLAIAGVVMGLGIAAMHYTGMAAVMSPILVSYDPMLVTASIVVACLAATGALRMARRGARAGRRLAAAAAMGAAVSSMHYTGMAAVCFSASGRLGHAGALPLHRTELALMVALGTAVILGIGAVSAVVDRRFASFRVREGEILRLAARRFEKLVSNAADPILVVDRSGRIEFAAASCRAMGRAAADLQGTSVFALVGGEGGAALRELLARPLPQEATLPVTRLEVADAAGRHHVFDAIACNLVEEPSVRGMVLTLRDVTEREAAADALVRARDAAEEASRLKSEFIAKMNHELRTPLNAVIGFAEVMLRDAEGRLGTATYREYARDIREAGAALLALVNDILDFSRLESGRMTLAAGEADAGDLVADCVRLVGPVAEAREVAIAGTAAGGMPPLLCDRRRLLQILLNLASNAVKFTPAGGAVRLSARLSGSGQPTFEVSDTGIGIPAGMLDRVTEPFFQVDGSLARREEGTGLGLAIARSLAELHGGRLELESEPGRGTTARLVLPACRVPGEAVGA